MSDSSSRQWLKRMLPARLLGFIQGCRYRGVRRHLKYSLLQMQEQRAFEVNNVGLGPTRIAFSDGLALQLAPASRWDFELFAFGDGRSLVEWRNFRSLTEGRSLMLDVGALYGVLSLAFASSPNRRAIAFEPSSIAFDLLKENMALNPSHAVEAHCMALGASSGTLTMRESYHFNVAVESAVTGKDKIEGQHEVQLLTVDEFVSGRGLSPDVLKIDVEGFELQVLLGAVRTLREFKPVIFLELHPPVFKDAYSELDAIHALLAEESYSILDEDLRHLCKKRFLETHVISNVVCIA